MSWPPPLLETKRLILVSVTSENVDESRLNAPIDPRSTNGIPDNWTIVLKPSGESIGSIGFIRWDRGICLAEIGFILKHTERRKGYMSEACQAAFLFGFEKMFLETIEARCMPENPASIALVKKMNMKYEERVRARLSSKGPLVDLDVFRIYKSNIKKPGYSKGVYFLESKK